MNKESAMNNRGYSVVNFLVSLGIVILVASVVTPELLSWLKTEKIASLLGEQVREFKSGYEDPKMKKDVPTIINSCNTDCLEGKQTIKIGDKIYFLGVVKNTWGDLEKIDCLDKEQ